AGDAEVFEPGGGRQGGVGAEELAGPPAVARLDREQGGERLAAEVHGQAPGAGRPLGLRAAERGGKQGEGEDAFHECRTLWANLSAFGVWPLPPAAAPGPCPRPGPPASPSLDRGFITVALRAQNRAPGCVPRLAGKPCGFSPGPHGLPASRGT